MKLYPHFHSQNVSRTAFCSLRHLFLMFMALLAMTVTQSCSEDDSLIDGQYGYVQFKIMKNSTLESTRAAGQLDNLTDAKKIEVMMRHNGMSVTQTLRLNSYDQQTAEWGVRSDRLKLLAGEYVIDGFCLYDKLDKVMYNAALYGADTLLVVEAGGLTVKNIGVNAQSRGMATFRLVKNIVTTRSTNEGYPFHRIKAVDIRVQHTFSKEITEIPGVKVTYTTGFHDDKTPGQNTQTAYCVCDTTVWLPSGNYNIIGYTTYSDRRISSASVLEHAQLDGSAQFVISDNKKEEVAVPITLRESDEYIKDYMALREIWLALDGPNWRLFSEETTGARNWNFNKDIDMWGLQPGVQLHANGRVASVNLGGFGAKGVVPDAIGQLTELKILSLGNHNELVSGQFYNPNLSLSEADVKARRWDYFTKFLDRDPREGLSDILKEAINRDPEQRPILSSRINLKDVSFGNLTNGITGISSAVKRIKGLEQFFIANSPITSDGFFLPVSADSPFYEESAQWSWADFTNLLDVEIYNCPKLDRLPMNWLGELPNLESLNISRNRGISAEQLRQDWTDLADSPSGPKLQLLYMGQNNLKEFPTHEHLSKMVKLGLLDCTSNKIEKLHPFGKGVGIVKFYIDNNLVEEIPVADDGFFFNCNDVENFSCKANRIKVFPNIFNARSIYVMEEVDFSDNQITHLDTIGGFKGVNTQSLNLSGNRLEKFPKELFSSGSPLQVLMLAGNGIKEIPEGSLQGKNAYMLTSLDLTYNKLTELPSDFRATTLPYLYGLDVSFNSFSRFPTQPLNVDHLVVFGIRHQRDENGNRTLREWPTGLYLCPSLRAFYIGSNDLRYIDDEISPNIYVFEIADNPNITITLTSTICSYIQYGYYMLIYDKTQDIRGCDNLDLE